MIRIGIITIALSLALSGCNGQSKTKEDDSKSSAIVPEAKIKVNKEYDKNGNLIKYDSTYSWYYSNIKGDNAKRDSVLNDFRTMFNHRYSFSEDPYFKNLFFQDSLFQYDFYKKDFFLNRYRNNMYHMQKLFEQMDSLKNYYFNKQFRHAEPIIKPK